MRSRGIAWSILSAGVWLGAAAAFAAASDPTAKEILEATGVKGGLIVHVDCGPSAPSTGSGQAGSGQAGKLTAALRADERYIVQGLETDAARLAEARKNIQALGVYGPVSAIRYDGKRLPYAENLVNLIVAGQGCAVGREEMMRVLAPNGVAYVENGGQWTKTVKPWPKDIDEWSHYQHGPDGNPVARDRVVGPPAHCQWTAEPLWLRDHDSDSSIDAAVTAQGRIFYLSDEAPISLTGDHPLPDKWFLVARDAFNGVLLWKVPVEHWGWREWKSTFFQMRPGDLPLNIEKRLVACADRVYVTLGYHAPVSELDAATGKVLQTYAGTEDTREILCDKGELILSVRGADGMKVTAVSRADGRLLWQTDAAYRGTAEDYIKVYPEFKSDIIEPALNIAADDKTVAFLNGPQVAALDRRTGKERWRATVSEDGDLWIGALIVADGVVLNAGPDRLVALSADTGEKLWKQPKTSLGHLWYEWKEVFVIDGLAWTWSAETKRVNSTQKGKASKTLPAPDTVNGYNLHTGAVEKQVALGNLFVANHHHRCYPDRATVRYIIASRRGSEFVDLEGGPHSLHNWVRGACHLGMIPANGLQYAPPSPCKCYIEEKINGFNALAPARPSDAAPSPEAAPVLLTGPAYESPLADDDAAQDDWPLFRHDAARSSSTTAKAPSQLAVLWQTPAGGALSAPVVAAGMVFAARENEHQAVAFDAKDGRPLWSFTTGARVDSPPAYTRGRVVFGSRDGWVYCLRAADGELAWKFRAAPEERQIGAYGQLESAWPVSGSVLIQDPSAGSAGSPQAGSAGSPQAGSGQAGSGQAAAYFAAGRSSFLDGGIRLYALDVATGKTLIQSKLEGPEPDLQNMSINFQLPMGALADILSCRDGSIVMRGKSLDESLVEQKQEPKGLIVDAGFLDDTLFKRTPWRFADRFAQFGNIFAVTPETVFGMQMFNSLQCLTPNNFFAPGAKGYTFFALEGAQGKQLWSEKFPVRALAMVATNEAVFAAGPPDVLDPADPLGAFEGRKGGVLLALDPATGAKVGQADLPSPPVFNGLAATAGRLFVSTADGRVLCLGV
ncbi:MAG: PQQ-binding-like beta-propeller repeat protein [Candidatus Sumerlaeota bacterium]|nr:PQQ-binding-like beta-propeller repeat protein [Candidatus Sumerlaeota bacterium]